MEHNVVLCKYNEAERAIIPRCTPHNAASDPPFVTGTDQDNLLDARQRGKKIIHSFKPVASRLRSRGAAFITNAAENKNNPGVLASNQYSHSFRARNILILVAD